MDQAAPKAATADESVDARHAGRVVVIVNPSSGKGLGRRALVRLREIVPRQCRDGEIYLSENPGFAARLLEGLALPPGTIVVAAGGDGTVHEVGTALLGREDLFFAVIPLGSGNDVAEQLGMPCDVDRALEAILRGVALPWDVGTVGGFTFLNSVGLGLSAETCFWSHRTGALRGLARYGLAAARAWWHHEPIKLTIDGMQASGERWLTLMEIAVGNRVGGGFRLTPDAAVDDGLLDVCLMDDASKWQIALLSPKGRRGTHLDHPLVHYEQLASFRIRCDRDLRMHVDGELHTLTKGEHSVRIRPKALKMIVAADHPRAVAS